MSDDVPAAGFLYSYTDPREQTFYIEREVARLKQENDHLRNVVEILNGQGIEQKHEIDRRMTMLVKYSNTWIDHAYGLLKDMSTGFLTGGQIMSFAQALLISMSRMKHDLAHEYLATTLGATPS